MKCLSSAFASTLIGAAALLTTSAAPAARPPNVVVVLADDQGWGDLGVNGNVNLATPAIDSLARDGAIFDRFYVSPVCSPTRAEFLTGRYHPRSGVRGVSTGGERMDLGEKTIADAFKRAGYAAGAFGKWHNGTQWPYHPNARGFDEYYGFTSGHWGSYFDPPLDHNGKPVKGKGFIIDDLTDHALQFIETNQHRPFFCYVPYNTPHSPMQVPERFYQQFAEAELKLRSRDPKLENVDFTRAALAMCENIDWNVGRILQRLADLKLADNTIVLYFSDNGPNSWRWNGGMKGRKGSTDEGGVRSPLLIRWPGRIPAGKTVPQIAGAIDLLPTLADLAGIQLSGHKPLDGLSLKPLLIGAAQNWPDRMLFSHWSGKISVRTQSHRLDSAGKLFDMRADPGQDHDLSAEQPELASRLSEAVAEWRKEMLPGFGPDTRPFTVGYAQFPLAQLPARDGVPHGNVRRSANAPNCSFFRDWTSLEDFITWDIEVATAGKYEVEVLYTCPPADVGSQIEVSFNDSRLQGVVTEAHDPPLLGAENDRVPRQGESYVKDFKPLRLGTMELKQGRGLLTLRALRIPGKQVMDVRAVHLLLVDVQFPKEGALPAKFPPDVRAPAYDPGEKDYYLFGTPERSLAQIAVIQAQMPPGQFTAPPQDWNCLRRARRLLTEGGTLRLLALGDSIVNDTMRSGWVAKLREAYPKANIEAVVYVRGGGGCQHYREEGRVAKHIIPRQPDLVFIGGISQKDIESIREVIHQVRAGLPEAEFLLATGTFGTTDPRDEAALAKAPHSGTGAYGQALKQLAAQERCAFLDMTTPWAEYVRSSGLHPHLFYRDAVHANEFGEQILSKILMAFLASTEQAEKSSGEEFVGPFPSWRDARRDYGARGDGLADDSPALQRALDELVKHTNACVLYLPAGTYRITATLRTVRKAHTDCQGVAIIGQDPARTVLRWDGTNGGTMVRWDAWYSKISRLTFDGAGRAGTALLYGPAFSTYNETSDLAFRDATNGLVFGGPETQGQAENAVLRCQFIRCGTGLQTVNWNSMDIWVWHSRFEDCGRGVHNVMGNWHVWESLFLRSRMADLSSINLMAFSAVNNTSLGSRCFFDFSTGHTWGSPVSLTGNRVLDPTGEWAVILDNAGPYLVVDNQFRLAGPARGVRMTWADQTLVGNLYSKMNAVEERGRFRRLAEKVVSPSEISGVLPVLPPTPPHRERKVFEVLPGANGDAIQRAVNEAAKLNGQRPVVHLPMGNYAVAETLVVPARCDLQLVGDSAGETGTRLNWVGPDDGVVLRLVGPSQVTLRDFYIHAGQARALLVEDCDQPRGRIFAEQLNVNGPVEKGRASAAALRLSGLDHTDVLLCALQGSGNGGRWVEVLGGPEAQQATNEVSVFTGATGSAAGQYDVRQGGRLVVRSVYHERSSDSLNGLHLADRGTLSIDATRFSYATSPTSPTVAADNFRGLFTLATCILLPVETKASCRFELRGDGSGASVLALNNQFWIEQKTSADDVWRNLAQPPARGGLIGCNINTSKKDAAPKGFEFLANIGDHPDPAKSASGAGPLDNRGTVDDATLLRHLAPLRAARVWLPDGRLPGNVTDLRVYRVMAAGGHGAVAELRARR